MTHISKRYTVFITSIIQKIITYLVSRQITRAGQYPIYTIYFF